MELLTKQLNAQGVSSREHFAFRCPMCRTVQSAASLIRAGAGKSFDDVEPYVAFSCIGRFTAAGPHRRGSHPGRGCDWTLGGLLGIHNVVLVLADGVERPLFDIAAADEAQALERQLAAPVLS